jgi:hypothetical protein
MSDGDEYKPRQVHAVDPTDYTKRKREGKDILSLIENLPDKSARNSLRAFVHGFDLSQFKQNDFEATARGWQGLMELALFIGPMGSRYRESIKLLISIMAGYAKTQKDYLEIQFPKQIMAQWDKLKDEMLQAAEPFMSEDDFREFKSRLGK